MHIHYVIHLGRNHTGKTQGVTGRKLLQEGWLNVQNRNSLAIRSLGSSFHIDAVVLFLLSLHAQDIVDVIKSAGVMVKLVTYSSYSRGTSS